jgi:Lsr2
MAKKVITTVELTDDIDGGKADQTLMFGFDGINYEIDLSKKNATAFTKILKPYVESGRKVRATRSTSTAGSRGKTRTDLSEIRAWANANGYKVSARGRISAEVVNAYDAS